MNQLANLIVNMKIILGKKKKKKTRLKFFICQISLNIALDGELFNHGAHIPGNGDFLSERQAGCVRTV